MENHTSKQSGIETFSIAAQLKQELSELLRSDSRYHSERKAFIQKAIEKVLALAFQAEEFQQKSDELTDVISAMGKGDFTKGVYLPGTKTLYATVGMLFNTLAEELEQNVVKKHYCQVLIDSITEAALITDNDGYIRFFNPSASQLTNFPSLDLLYFNIANIFESKKQFCDSASRPNGKLNVSGFILPKNLTHVPVDILIKEIKNEEGQTDGYLYIIKRL